MKIGLPGMENVKLVPHPACHLPPLLHPQRKNCKFCTQMIMKRAMDGAGKREQQMGTKRREKRPKG